ncbi:hypothetical protein [Streptomyces caatingaensis]|uniref:Uncharacterized protein n=1 Tax=Streptomyces caatingaensis TaxID=1678637 RepID=A0A0K9XAI8_9ACTN|nr:hypothetical protein [Streptomyces caatingaensis]KNB50435.1 hypothetical protein AC230_22530 [Streptomyces caatingaensis]
MTGRRLRDLGLHSVPLRRPLDYPGRPVREACLLRGDELLPLRAREGALGTWRVVDGGATGELDGVLEALGAAPAGRRHPVVAVGSNASPAQIAHKLGTAGVPAVVPMVPVTVRGIGVGCSAHIGRAGYVAAAPYADPDAERPLVVGWLDPAQMAVVDASEVHYRRVLLPGAAYPMTPPAGPRLGGAYVYVSRHGVLLDPATGRPRPGGGDQSALLRALLAASPRLRALLGPDPAAWIRRARNEDAVRELGARIFAEEGWVRAEEGLPGASGQGDLSHAELSP